MSEIIRPTEADATRILKQSLGFDTQTIARFSTGAANYVYDVETTDGHKLVVRLARSDLTHYIEGGLYWHPKLLEKSVPLARLHAGDPTTKLGFAYMVIDRLPGQDLWHEYASMSKEQKHQLAKQMVTIQNNVATLPQAKGYGFAQTYEQPNWHRQWSDVVQSNLDRSRARIETAKIVDTSIVDRVSQRMPALQSYFDQILPEAFLDDTTTKNVIIDNGQLSGIVDTDMVCFGDRLKTVGLTRASLLAHQTDADYTDLWMQELSVTPEQRQAVEFYTALSLVDFLSAFGHAFNKEDASYSQTELEHLQKVFESVI